MSVSLPYPPAVLNPNSRVHWSKKTKAASQYKEDCHWILRAHINQGGDIKGIRRWKLTFCPPDGRRRDLDNQLASVKQALDALSEISGVDDSKFALTIEKGEPVKGGCVIVEPMNG
jgi:crossover junction endodeoxyribonuclease RusA